MNQSSSFPHPPIGPAALAERQDIIFNPNGRIPGLATAMSALLLSALTFQANAAVTMSNSGATAPSAGDSGISQLSSGGALSGSLDYSNNGGALGQSFTLGAGTFNLNAISLNASGDFGNTAYAPGTTWNVQISRYDNAASGPFAERSDGPLVPFSSQFTSNPFVNQVFTGIAAIGTDPTAGDWITFSFTGGDVLTLEGEHTYSFQIATLGAAGGWAGFNVAASDVEAGGERFQAWGTGAFNDNWVQTQDANDRTFVVNLSAVPEPSAALLSGLAGLMFLRRRR